MLIRHRRSWEIPERDATPEHLFLNRRSVLAGAAALGGGALAAGPARAFSLFGGDAAPAAPEAPDPLRGALPGEARPRLHGRRPGDARGGEHELQQLLRIRHVEARRRRGADAARAPLDDQVHRDGGDAAGGGHRRPAQGHDAGGAALPPPLRRGLGHAGAVDGLPGEEAGRFRQAARLRQIHGDEDLQGPPRWRRASGASSCSGPMSRG